MRWPLRNQIMLPLLGVAVASLLAVGAINAWLAARQTRERIEAQLQGVVRVLAESNFPLTDGVLRQMRDLSRAEFLLGNSAGQITASSFEERPGALPTELPTAAANRVSLGSPIELLGARYFHTVTTLPPRAGAGESRRLHVLFPESEYRRSWREAFVPPLVVSVLAIAAAAAAAQFVAKRISRTTARLATEVVRLARGDFDPVELPPTDDELRDLSIAVNRTAEMLADYRDQVRRTERMRTVAMLGAGLAHEMRNAATGCRMALDLHAGECGSGADDESLDVARRQLRLMESQLQRFLQIGKSPAEAPRRPVEIRSLIEGLLPLVQPAVRHAKIELEWRPPDGDMTVLADDEGLGQSVLNLLLNAIEAVQQQCAPAPRRITIELGEDDRGTAVLCISDSGPGPSDDVSDSLFDPFVTSKAEGVGLGLAVARQVVETYQGTINWSRENGVTSFRVELPLAVKGLACV